MTRPAPAVGRDNEFFWSGVSAGEIRVQRCADCKVLRHPPSPMCPTCQSLRWEAEPVDGSGTVYSYVVCHHPLPPWESGPYAVVLVELEAGVRVVCSAPAIPLESIAIGVAVEVRPAEVEPGIRLLAASLPDGDRR